MGRVVRGMGAIGWEGASDMAAVCTGAIGRLGESGDVDRRGNGRADGGVDAGTAQRRQTPAAGLAGSAGQLRPPRPHKKLEDRFMKDVQLSTRTTIRGLRNKWRPKPRYVTQTVSSKNICFNKL